MAKDKASKEQADNISAFQRGDRSAFDALMSDYEPLIRSEAAKMIQKHPEFASEAEEFSQEGRMALYKAAGRYDQSVSDVTFGLYAKICVHNRMISYLRKLVSKKRKQDKAFEAKSVALSSSSADAGERLIALERSELLMRFLSSEVTPLEKECFKLYLQKLSYRDIAKSLGKSEKSVDNAICRTKAKLKRFLNG